MQPLACLKAIPQKIQNTNLVGFQVPIIWKALGVM